MVTDEREDTLGTEGGMAEGTMGEATLAMRLGRALSHAGLNQKQVEDRAGLTRGYISRPLNGTRARLGTDILHRIASACGVDYLWLSTGHGAMAPGGAPTEESHLGTGTGMAPGTSLAREDRSAFTRALGDAFRRGEFELMDLDAIRRVLRNGAALLRDETDLVDAATSWLHAAAVLRREGRPVTIETLAYRMATHGSARTTTALDARTAALNAEAREQLRGLGAEPPDAPVLPPRRGG